MADFRVQTEAFTQLKGTLLPLGRPGEEERFAAALKAIDLALRQLDMATVLDDRVRSLIGTLDDAIGRPRGKRRLRSAEWALRADRMSPAARTTFAEAVDELAGWFAKWLADRLAKQPRPLTASEIALDYARDKIGGIAWEIFKKL